MKLAIACLIFVACSQPGFSSEPCNVIRDAAGLIKALQDRKQIGAPFDITVQVTTDCPTGDAPTFAVKDESGAAFLHKQLSDKSDPDIHAGMDIRARGFIWMGTISGHAYPACRELAILGRHSPAKPRTVTAKEFLCGKVDYQPVFVRGKVRDVIKDDIDPRFICVHAILDGESIFISKLLGDDDLAKLKPGAEIESFGFCAPNCLSARRLTGRVIRASFNGLTVISPSSENAFDAPEISDFNNLRPIEIAKLDRHRAIGHVLAVWGKNKFLIRTDDDRVVRIETIDDNPPMFGNRIEAVGFPESDLYRINLSRAIWRLLPQKPHSEEPPRYCSVRQLQTDESGRRRYISKAHGRVVKLHGIVRTIPSPEKSDGRFSLESEGMSVPVDFSSTQTAIEGLSVGCEISVTGVCVMESENWRPFDPFPSIRGLFVVIRQPEDIVILRQPSWWTPSHLLYAIGILLFALFFTLVWTVLLKRTAERRGKELARTAIAKTESDLRIYERTRLSVELHDSLSQYLTGISLAIRAATRLVNGDHDALMQNLNLATASLDSCRQELRNCLWDLRSQTLDEPDINTAIRQTLEPHLGNASLSIRFNIPRDRFSDNTAHAILHILRELTTNAVRHGHASQIKIAGSIENDRFLFSVQDNGCGFDTNDCPGMDKGHFGIQGVRERVNQFEGAMSIVSSRGKGTKVSISMHIPHETTVSQ